MRIYKYYILSYLVDIAIPTYSEKDYIERTLYHLTQQHLYKKDRVHIILGDYKNELNIDDTYLEDLAKNYKHVTYIPVYRKGIAYARNMALMQSKSNIYMNFDADSCFNRLDAIELMISPILDNNAVLTNCETILYDFENNKPVDPLKNAFTIASNIGNLLEKSLLGRGPGLTVTRDAFLSVGGFRDVDQSEDYLLTIDIIQSYGVLRKKFIETVKILTSHRRAIAFEKHGLNTLNYTDNHFR